MQLSQSTSEIFVHDETSAAQAAARTTHLGVVAHQDDLEILAIHGIVECFQKADRWFSGVVVTDGAGSARAFDYAAYDDASMRAVRRKEQKKAAFLGEYSALFLLDHPSARAKDPSDEQVIDDLVQVLEATRPEVVYTHNLADKHATHLAVALRLIAACRRLSTDCRPSRVIGAEVWRDLDWLPDELKIVMPVESRENLQAALLGVFDSQIVGGKRYDRATLGRRRAHATFSESHGIDSATGLVYGMDLTPLIADPDLDPVSYVEELIVAFRQEVRTSVRKLL